MKIRTGTYGSMQEAGAYFGLFDRLYGSMPGVSYYSGDLRKAMSYTLENANQEMVYISLMEADEMMAHCALISDKRLPSGDLFFGFFECSREKFFQPLWNEVLSLAKDQSMRRLLGPINGSIWHAYRVIRSGDNAYPYFASEPVTQDWYHRTFRSLGPEQEISYYSASRKNFQFIIRHTADACQSLMQQGYKIEVPDEIDAATIIRIFHLATKVFSGSWAYTEIGPEEFGSLYSEDKIRNHIGRIYLLEKDDDLIGFCSTVLEKKKLIIKTIAVDPEHHRRGFGNALIHRIHSDAVEEGIQEIIYALIRSTNKVQHFPKEEATIFREYAAFEFRIS